MLPAAQKNYLRHVVIVMILESGQPCVQVFFVFHEKPCLVGAMAEGPAFKKQRLPDIEPGKLPNWLGAQVEGLCTEEQKRAIQKRFAKYTKEQLQSCSMEFFNMALMNIVEDEDLRLQLVLVISNATCAVPPAPATCWKHGILWFIPRKSILFPS